MTQVNQLDFAYSHNDAQLQKYSNPEKAWIELINNIQQKVELESKRYSTAREMYSFEETPYQPPADPRILSAARVMSFHDHVLVWKWICHPSRHICLNAEMRCCHMQLIFLTRLFKRSK